MHADRFDLLTGRHYVTDIYKPLAARTPDTQYRDRVRQILETGIMVQETAQDVPALTCFGTLSPMVFDMSNGFPMITERKCTFWKQAVSEIIAFVNGARDIDEIASFGCTKFWEKYRGKGIKYGLEPNDMGPGSYGGAFAAFETPDGGTLDQFVQLIDQIKRYPDSRTHLITPWKPYYTPNGPNRKVIVRPCHGWLHFRVINGTLHMRMDQRSADLPIGVPSNMIEYAALLLMVCRITGYQPGNFIHSLSDAHIYENQISKMEELVARETRIFPSVYLTADKVQVKEYRTIDFTLEDYDPHPAMTIPFTE